MTYVGCAIEVHKTLGGPGVLESVYQKALAYEFKLLGTRSNWSVPVL